MTYLDAVTRLRRTQTGVDRYKNPTFEEVSTELPGARFAPRDDIPSPEVGREPIVIEPTAYWHKKWPDITESDRLIVRGVTYEVQTPPADWRGRAGAGGLVVKLKATKEGVL